MWSSLAERRPARKWRWRRIKPWGMVVHTTGRGIVHRAQKRNDSAAELAIEYYRSKAAVHYLVDWNGTIIQMMPDDFRGAHVGISKNERKKYLSGRWRRDFSNEVRKHWHERWPSFSSPQHLYPTRSPNSCYLGVELVPLPRDQVQDDDFWFTPDQHQAVVDLGAERALFHGWGEDWWKGPRLVGHEDIDAYGRWQESGGWDPGALREVPRFDWPFVYAGMEALREL